ncbi:hypothetical protein EDC01DRAFT_628254 [Geopyxis carbonaria]|nr:hypothetical protein EDC01DRAFT_628254 [Geopyxis carbonaria]
MAWQRLGRSCGLSFLGKLLPDFVWSTIAKLASHEAQVTLGQIYLVKTSWKLHNWSEWYSGLDRFVAGALFRKSDQKVWTYFRTSEDPLLKSLSDDSSLELQTKTSVYTDGFPAVWRDSDNIPKETITKFRVYARFWYHQIYDTSQGGRLGVHLSELPADFPDNEREAFRQVGEKSYYRSENLTTSTPRGAPAQLRSDRSSAARSQELFNSHSKRAPLTREAASESPVRPDGSESPSDDPDSPVRRRRSRRNMVHTTFPRDVRADNLIEFDGKPYNLLRLDRSVEDLCGEHDYPAYYGGTVVGNRDRGYKYVDPDFPGSADNYHFGSRICSAVCARFTSDADMWWQEYRDQGGQKPNCWKLSSSNPEGDTRPDDVVELSLFELLQEHFPADNEANARIELSRLKWNPAVKGASSLTAFRSSVMSLSRRAGFTKWSLQCAEIRKCIEPASRGSIVLKRDTEALFWMAMKDTVDTWLDDHGVVPGLRKCDSCGGNHDTKDCRRNLKRSDRPENRQDLRCTHCQLKGHTRAECFKLRNAIARGEFPADRATEPTRYNNRPARDARNAPPPRDDRPTYKQGGCRKCGGSGHNASVCPSRPGKTAIAAPNIQTQGNAKDPQSGKAVPLYHMSTWRPINGTQVDEAAGPRTNEAMEISNDEGVDEFFSLLFANKSVDVPLYNNLTKDDSVDEVVRSIAADDPSPVRVTNALDMSKLGPPVDDSPTGPVWTVASTLRNQDILTIFDTGAVKAVIPLSTARGTSSRWSRETPQQISFVKADGTHYKPEGFCPSFRFRFGCFEFDIQAVFVVDRSWYIHEVE